MPIRVLIVDDHPIVRSGLLALLTEASGFEPVGEAHDGVAALAAIRRTRPDVVLMDLTMPNLSGVEATRRVVARPETAGVAVLVLTMSDDDASLAAAVKAGAQGYLLKDAGAEEVLAAVRAVARGEVVFGRGVLVQADNQLASRAGFRQGRGVVRQPPHRRDVIVGREQPADDDV